MKNRMIFLLPLFLALCLLFSCAGSEGETPEESGAPAEDAEITEKESTEMNYIQISQEEARIMMARDDGHIIVDVRRIDEYEEGHIKDAVCIPNEDIGTEPPPGLSDKEQIILIYCRSGRRSKEAAQKLADMGYTNVYEFGGIIDWEGETVKDIIKSAEPTPMLVIKVNGRVYYASLENNASAKEFSEKLSEEPLTLEMSDYGGFEKVGTLPYEITRSDEKITASPGDVILYLGRNVTVYYGTNEWDFTRLAHIYGATGEELLSVFGEDGVTMEFSVEWSE